MTNIATEHCHFVPLSIQNDAWEINIDPENRSCLVVYLSSNPDLPGSVLLEGHFHFFLGQFRTRSSGWWSRYPSEKYDFVNWDEYSQYMEK